MKPPLKFLLTACALAVTSGAHAGTERIVCETGPGASGAPDCVLLRSDASPPAGGTPPAPAGPEVTTYYATEPERPASSATGAPAAPQARAVQPADLDQPPGDPLPFPYPSNLPGDRAQILYVVDPEGAEALRRGGKDVIPAQRLVVTQPDPLRDTD